MVRDPGNGFTENSSLVTFVEKTRGPAASDGTNVSPNSQDESGNTLPRKSPAPRKFNFILQVKACF